MSDELKPPLDYEYQDTNWIEVTDADEKRVLSVSVESKGDAKVLGQLIDAWNARAPTPAAEPDTDMGRSLAMMTLIAKSEHNCAGDHTTCETCDYIMQADAVLLSSHDTEPAADAGLVEVLHRATKKLKWLSSTRVGRLDADIRELILECERAHRQAGGEG